MQARWREYMRPTSTSPLADTLVLAGAILNLKSSPSLTPGRRAQVRARLGAALADTVTQADAAAWAAFDVAALLRVAARLVGDNTPEAREAGRRLVGAAHDAFRTGRLGAAGAAAAGGAPGDGSDVRRARDGAQARARALAAPWPRARARARCLSVLACEAGCRAPQGAAVEGKENRAEDGQAGADAAAGAGAAAKGAPDPDCAWQGFCSSRLDPAAVAAVLRASCSAKP